jgi:signal transduction histidine kinase/ligand-binding sensor domain-containing protein/DNA-binding response OmpR family regulator
MILARLIPAILLIAVSFQGFSQSTQYRFARLDVNDGLSHNMVNDFVKDSAGFMWIATLSGLNRFDGHSIKSYRNIPGDSTSLLVNDVTKLFEGPKGSIWMYTHSGNCVYDPKTETFRRNTNAILRSMGIAEGLITFVKKDSKGNYWFIHYNQGLFRYTPGQNRTIRLFPAAGDRSSISSAEISAVTEDTEGSIWVLHKNGLVEKLDENLKVVYKNSQLIKTFSDEALDLQVTADTDGDLWIYSNSNHGCFVLTPAMNVVRRISTDTNVKLKSSLVRKVVQDDRGIIWIATDHGGICLVDKKNDFSVRHLTNDAEDDKTISQNSINALYKDNDGIIWAGSYKKGVSYYHENIFRFELLQHHTSKPGSLPFNDVNALAEDSRGNVWIGTNGGGLFYFDREKNTFRQYLHDPDNKNSLSSNIIVSLFIDHEQVLWIGTYYGGLNAFDGKSFRHFMHDPANSRSIGDDSVWEILEDADHNLWIGTLRGGVDVYKRDKDEFYHYRHGDLNSIHTTYVPALREDRDGNMWLGTGYGVDVLEKQSGRFVHYLNDVNDPGSISNNSILSILEDSRGLMWVATHGGLNLFDKRTRKFRAFQEADGLPHNSVLTLVEDNDHNLWMSTPNGISKLTISEGADASLKFSFRNYDESDGLQGRAFNENAVLKCSTGEIMFGGSNGLNVFRPEHIGLNTIKPKVILTDFQVFNKSVKIGQPNSSTISMDESITGIREIALNYADNVFSIEFAALNFFHPEKSRYKYMLEGFNNDWLTTDSKQRRVTFTNIDPGEYYFKVKASNNDGIWNEAPTTVKITISPPFWRSNFAFALYALAIIGGLLLARWLILTKERMNYRIAHERREAQRMHELDMMKIRFFTNVSHEFRTPLSLIITPVEKLLTHSTDKEQQNQYQLIHRNAKRLLNLVNQLLDFRKMEVQETKFSPSEGDIIRFIKELVNSFSDISEKKNIALSFSSTVEGFETLFDQDKVEKIIFNLLSNAFKFTPEHGTVAVILNLESQGAMSNLRIEVRDSGIGVPEDKQEKIFERFFQHDTPRSIVNQGSGIGLSITKEFVKVHGGSICVESEPGQGSSFVVNLPLPRINPVEVPNDILDEIARLSPVSDHPVHLLDHPDDVKKPVLLLVEDNEDFRFYLKDNLRLQYHVLEAANGKLGLQKALASIPDLIVSDIMMPEMNGIEFCRKLRQDPHTSHIPVVLLTARTSDEQKLEGFETGASDYITKPFNFEILQSRIKNLLHQRMQNQQAFQKHFDVKASDIKITSMDEKMIQNAIRIVEDHISDPDFSVEELSREMAMSRVHLYKKLLSLTGKSPIEFIRTIRLQRAAQLLQKSQLTVAEVAYQVGFNNPKYFTKYFKDEFHILPSVYAGKG